MQNRNMQALLADAQKKQKAYDKLVQEIEETEYEISKNGIVKVVMLGNLEVVEIKIEKEALTPDDAEFIEESIVMAINAIVKNVRKDMDEAEQKTIGQKNSIGF